MNFWEGKLLGLELFHYWRCLGFLFIGFFFKGLISRFLSKYVFKLFVKDEEYDYSDSFAMHIRRPLSNFIFIVFAYLAFMQLAPLFGKVWLFKQQVEKHTDPLLMDAQKVLTVNSFTLLTLGRNIFFFLQILSFTQIVLRVMVFFFSRLEERAIHRADRERQQLLPLLRDVLRVLIWVTMIFVILGVVFKVNVAALVAGLGVGGIAIAFALKDSLENLLSSFMILLDKPFVIGDHVKINGVEGNVESVGFRSTAIRTFDQSLVSLPNRNLISNALENFTQRGMRRVRLVVGVPYGLSVKQLQDTVTAVRERINTQAHVTGTTNVYVDNFGDSGIEIVIVYFIRVAEGVNFTAAKEKVNYEIYEAVYQHATGFVFPTQALVKADVFDHVTKADNKAS